MAARQPNTEKLLQRYLARFCEVGSGKSSLVQALLGEMPMCPSSKACRRASECASERKARCRRVVPTFCQIALSMFHAFPQVKQCFYRVTIWPTFASQAGGPLLLLFLQTGLLSKNACSTQQRPLIRTLVFPRGQTLSSVWGFADRAACFGQRGAQKARTVGYLGTSGAARSEAWTGATGQRCAGVRCA